MTMKDGGLAFGGTRTETVQLAPAVAKRLHTPNRVIEVIYPGMSLRDWFAGQALAGIIANHSATADIWRQYAGTSGITTPEQAVARACYLTADALLTEREKETT